MTKALYFAFAAVIPTAVASAQRTQHTKPAAPARVAAIAPAPAAPQAASNRGYYGHGAFRSDLPILLMSDGRVFADFGRGWESVSRSCSVPVGYAGSQVVSPSGLQQPVVVQPTVTQPTAAGLQRLPYTPPVPNQPTPSQEMAQNAGRLPEANTARQSCWARAQDGRVLVAQP